ncbi:acetolactate synthase [Janibacter anophelis]|uniref:acetolactate synthase n=1 Tax=Janibacter anophelis TaxID=319054 RepID=UPI000B1FAF38|nr:acetolactate synthase [Janibacter anophelis]
MEHYDEVSGGMRAVSAAAAHGVETMFTLSGAHVFPLYDGAVTSDPPMRLLDVRHEQTAVFAAEATGKLTRTPGLAVLTAGPGVTNGVSAITQAHFSGAPLVVLGGRAASFSWGRGALQEFDHPSVLGPITKRAATVGSVDKIADEVDEAFRLAAAPHRGPVFLDVPMDELFGDAEDRPVAAGTTAPHPPEAGDVDAIARLLAGAERPLVILGTDVWSDGADEPARRCVTDLGLPTITNGMGRGILPAGHELLVGKARRSAVGGCDLAIVVGTPLDFRLGYGSFGGQGGAPEAQVVHVADSPGQLSTHAQPAATAAGDLTSFFDQLQAAVEALPHTDWSAWADGLSQEAASRAAQDRELLTSPVAPIHPARIYGELVPRLADDAVVIGDGGDFVSWAGRFVEPSRPGRWLDPGPFGCLGAGLGAAIAARIAHPSSQVVLLLGDGASGMSLMDVDTLVRHGLPVVMVMGNNGAWGLEKQPMQMLYGYDVAADLAPGTRYDQVVTALGGGGELVTDPAQIGPALDRAFASGVPYLVNIVTDPEIPYPRSTTGM